MNIFTPSTSTKIILVRHGRSTFNEQGRYQGSSNESVLTELGKKAAFLTGLALKDSQFDAIYSSPLTRVKQTTNEIVNALSTYNIRLPTIVSDRRLQEVNMADWEGLSYSYVRENFPQEYACWQQTPHLFKVISERDRSPAFYPLQDLYQRASSCLQDLLARHQGKTVLVVAHGGTNRALISTAIGLNSANYHSLQQSNCGISCLEFPEKNSTRGRLLCLNVTEHLGEYLPKLKAGKTGWRWLLLSNTITKDALNNSFLTKLSHQNPIDLIVTDNSPSSESLASNIISNENSPVCLTIDRDRFLESWQETILDRQKLNNDRESTHLFTGLVIAPQQLFSRILAENLKIKTSWNNKNYLSVIHYPQAYRQCILQGLFPINRELVSRYG